MPLPPTKIQGDKNDRVYKKDPDGNEITALGKWIAGIFLIILTFLGCLGIIRYWPDRLPKPEERLAPLYINEPFHVKLACVPDSPCNVACVDCYKSIADTAKVKVSGSLSADTLAAQADTSKTNQPGKSSTVSLVNTNKLLHINTILLILVALGGFVGNMIHVGTSFTTFVGAGKFKRSWLLWYCIKPFTAAALAIGIYFVFRGGFLNMSDGGASINLYGLMTISLFAGLFTDKATEKLKEVFEVLFRSKEERPDPLTGKFKITGISPLIIEKETVNKMTISGEKLDIEKLIISINDEVIPDKDKTVSSTNIVFNYKLPDALKDQLKVTLSVKDEKGKEHYTVVLTVKSDNASNNESFPTDGNPPPPIDYHDESNISNKPPAEPPPNIK